MPQAMTVHKARIPRADSLTSITTHDTVKQHLMGSLGRHGWNRPGCAIKENFSGILGVDKQFRKPSYLLYSIFSTHITNGSEVWILNWMGDALCSSLLVVRSTCSPGLGITEQQGEVIEFQRDSIQCFFSSLKILLGWTHSLEGAAGI